MLNVRTLSFVIAVWYGIAGSNVAYPILDRIASQGIKTVAADFPCARHACGCRTAEQCRLHCCCRDMPGAQPRAISQSARPLGTIRIRYLAALACSGGGQSPHAVSLQRFEPNLPGASLTRLASVPLYRATLDPSLPTASAFRDAPDKVPI